MATHNLVSDKQDDYAFKKYVLEDKANFYI